MDTTDTPKPVELDPLAELDSMKVIAETLKGKDDDSIRRILRWALDALPSKSSLTSAPSLIHSREVAAEVSRSATTPAAGAAASGIKARYPSLPDFYAGCAPSMETDKALVVGYWVQVAMDGGEFDAFTVNKELKHLGYKVANITSAFDTLQARRPQLVIQTRKSGSSKQARKLYKLTVEGIRAVERMAGGSEE